MSDLRSALESAFEKHGEDTPVETLPEKTDVVTTDKPELTYEKTRDETGKFAKKDEPLEQPTEEKPQRKAPSSWKPDAQTAWLKADRGEALTPDEVKILALEAERREGDFHKGVSEFKTHSERARQYDQVVAPYQATLKQLGIDAPTAISKLLQADHTLRTADPMTKAAYIRGLAQQYGVDLDQTPQADEYTQQMMFELQNLRNQQMMWQNNNHIAQQDEIGNTLIQFSDGRPHFDVVRNDMADLIESGKAKTLEDAYEKALWLNPEVRKSLIDAETSKRMEDSQRAQKAKAAAVSVKGSSPSVVGSQQLKGSLRDVIAAQVYQS
jgi:hypothetical protein